MKKTLLNEVKQLQKIAGILKESKNPTEILGNLVDQMQDDEEGLDQGLKPSELIDYNQIAEKAATLGLRVDIKKLKQLAKANDTGFLYSGEEMISMAI